MKFHFCDHVYRLAESWRDSGGMKWVEYHCIKCGRVERERV